MATVFRVDENVNDNFKSVWTSKKPNTLCKGGRSSNKSSVISLWLAVQLAKHISRGDAVNVVVLRKVANTIRDSVFNKMQWALSKVGIMEQFKATKSPFVIRHIETGSSVYFYGQDDYEKLKSNDINGLIAVWFEEATEFNSFEEFDQAIATFARQKHPSVEYVRFFWSFNPPRNPYSWINEWTESLQGESDWLVHSSSYLDDKLGFVNEQMLKEIERIKRNDYDYYRYLYLGEPVGLGTNVYNMSLFKMVYEIPQGEMVMYVYYSADGGHQQSATTCLCIAVTNKGNVYIVDNYYYSPSGKVEKKAPSELSADIHEFVRQTIDMPRLKNSAIRKRTIDSAEGALRNQYYKDYRQRWNPVAKRKKVDMVGFVHTLLAQGRVYVLNTHNNKEYFIKEHRSYCWDERTVHSDNPSVVKSDDHTCDAFQYFVVDNLLDLSLRG